jgi:predicted helicase
VFGSGSRTPVAVTVMIKDPEHKGACELYYHDIGDYLSRDEKLSIVEEFKSIENIAWKRIIPNTEGDWINQRDPLFNTFIELGNKEDKSAKKVFDIYSSGVKTNRDAWVYNFSREALGSNMLRMIENYNAEVDKYTLACGSKPENLWPKFDDCISTDPKHINWSRELKNDAMQRKKYEFEERSITTSHYRPFNMEWLYFNRRFNNTVYLMPSLFPTIEHENIVISVTGPGASKGFSALVSKYVPNYHLHDTSQCFPLYWYEKVESDQQGQVDLFDNQSTTIIRNGYIRHEAITDWAIIEFRKHYTDDTIGKEDIFWYVYGILHSQEYRQRFAADLKKMLPRIPLALNFWEFSSAGRKLGEWHLNYETVEPYPLTEQAGLLLMDESNFRVAKMVFGKANGRPDKSRIVVNQYLTLHNIPIESYEYIVNGKSAIEWVMERYAVDIDKDSGINNDPNDWSNDPRYIIDLLKRIVRVSVESVKIINQLPGLEN